MYKFFKQLKETNTSTIILIYEESNINDFNYILGYLASFLNYEILHDVINPLPEKYIFCIKKSNSENIIQNHFGVFLRTDCILALNKFGLNILKSRYTDIKSPIDISSINFINKMLKVKTNIYD